MTDKKELDAVAKTALWTAAARARESERADRLFEDPFAAVLAGAEGRALLKHFHTSHAADEGNPFLPIRTRWFDDFVAGRVTGERTQVVGLGAGLDTRAFRLQWPDHTVLYEVDQPALLNHKSARLAEIDARPRCDRRTVPVDLRDDWAASLVAAGFDPGLPTVWFGEGLLFYLPEDAAHGVLATAKELSAAGSELAVDLIGTGIFRFPYTRDFLGKLQEADSPWVFGTDDPARFIAGTGWDVVAVTEPGKPDASFGRWPALATPDLPDLPRSYLAIARQRR